MQYVEYKGEKIEVVEGTLNLGNRGIWDISEVKGLRNLRNLKVLNLSGNKIREIKDLENLFNLDLGKNEISRKILKKLDEISVRKFSNDVAHNDGELFENLIKLKNYWRAIKEGTLTQDSIDTSIKYFSKSSNKIDFTKVIEYFSKTVVEYCQQKRKRREIIEEETIKKLNTLIEKSNKVNLNQIKDTLEMDTHTFNNKIIDWADEFNFIIDGDYLVINKDTVSDFIDALDKQFASWEKGKEKLE